MAVDKSLLLKGRVPEGEVEIPGVGTVRVRGLSRGEVFGLQKLNEKRTDVGAYERKLLALGMLDPVLTEIEVQSWQENSPAGELEPVVEKIRDLSGLAEGADKSRVPPVRE